MGAQFNDHAFTAAGWEEAIAAAKSYQQEQCFERGHGSYTGHLGTVQGVDAKHRLEFESYDAAIAFIDCNHQKWEPPMLVRVRGTNGYVFAGNCPS